MYARENTCRPNTRWLGPIVKENEYQYFQHNVDWLNQVMVSMDLNLPVHLLSFFGHYGVPVFLFLSAYGMPGSVVSAIRGCVSAGRKKRFLMRKF